MDFTLVEFHAKCTDEELLGDILRVASIVNSDYITMKQYANLGHYSYSTAQNHFGGWSNALRAAGLKPKNIKSKRRYSNLSLDELSADLVRVANNLGTTSITTTQYEMHGKYNYNTYCKVFGCWDKALYAAGLDSTGYTKVISDQDLFSNIEEMWITLGRQPKARDFSQGHSKYSIRAYYNHFGSWHNALVAFIDYINNDLSNISNAPKTVDNSFWAPDTTVVKKSEAKKDLYSSHETKRDIGLKTRFLVMKRDNFKCCLCGASPAKDPSVVLHVDHIIPWSKGGETVVENLQTLCSNCNLGKGNII